MGLVRLSSFYNINELKFPTPILDRPCHCVPLRNPQVILTI